MAAQKRLRIAISGGGLGGAAIANALHGLPHLEICIYESAESFSERGAAVGLSSNAMDALAQVVDSSDELLRRAGASDMNSSRSMLVSLPSHSACN